MCYHYGELNPINMKIMTCYQSPDHDHLGTMAVWWFMEHSCYPKNILMVADRLVHFIAIMMTRARWFILRVSKRIIYICPANKFPRPLLL